MPADLPRLHPDRPNDRITTKEMVDFLSKLDLDSIITPEHQGYESLYALYRLLKNYIDNLPAGSGNVTGTPPSTTDNLASFADTTGLLIEDSGIAKADVSSAVSLKHSRKHAIDSTNDHTGTATTGKVLIADANSLPSQGTNTDTEIASAVTLKHNQAHMITAHDPVGMADRNKFLHTKSTDGTFEFTTIAAGGDFSTDTSSVTNGHVVIFQGTGGKTGTTAGAPLPSSGTAITSAADKALPSNAGTAGAKYSNEDHQHQSANDHNRLFGPTTDFVSGASTVPWTVRQIGGTGSAGGSNASANSTANRIGVLQMKTGTAANSGTQVYLGSNLLLAGGETTEALINLDTTTNLVLRFGFDDSTTVSTPVDGAYIDIQGTQVQGITVDNSSTSLTASTGTVAAGTDYRLKVIVNSDATLVTFKVLTAADAEVWSDTISTNIPTGAGRYTGHALTAVISAPPGGVATNIVTVDWMTFYCDRALTR